MDSKLWIAAANRLDAGIKDQILTTLNEPCGIDGLLVSIDAAQKQCSENRWTLYRKLDGKRVYFHDVFSNAYVIVLPIVQHSLCNTGDIDNLI
jgi:hypothetical protein